MGAEESGFGDAAPDDEGGRRGQVGAASGVGVGSSVGAGSGVGVGGSAGMSDSAGASPLTTEPTLPGAARGHTPRSLTVSFFGAYGRDLGGWIAVADLVTLLGGLGFEAPAVRSAVSRQKQRGFLEAEQRDGAAGYRLSPAARQILADGDRRIYRRAAVPLAEGWVLAVFSVPESERHRRHVLRSRLARLGFGTTAPGVWIAPAHLAEEARHMLERLELTEYVDLFRAEYLAYADPRSAAARWWDLAAVQSGYADFAARFQDADANPGSDAAAFGSYLRAVDAWRRLPYSDPGLPAELLPDDWCGAKAADVFFALHDNLREPGLRYVRGVVGG